jgi:hypothetical protein
MNRCSKWSLSFRYLSLKPTSNYHLFCCDLINNSILSCAIAMTEQLVADELERMWKEDIVT